MFEKVRNFFKEKSAAKIVTASVVAPATTFALSVPAFAAESGGGASSEYQTVVTAVSNTLSSANLTSVLTYAVGIAVGLVFLWWAVRKVTGILKRAFMRGKLRL